jgi:hypothetical protein
MNTVIAFYAIMWFGATVSSIITEWDNPKYTKIGVLVGSILVGLGWPVLLFLRIMKRKSF